VRDLLPRLQRWYTRQCDGDWEHQFGVEIRTLDNPGWLVKIDLTDSDLDGRPFEPLTHGLDVQECMDWHSLSTKDGVFEGAGDPSKLAFILQAFLDWAEQNGSST
jgi:hypothetical protein